jgi:hypothetical protein
VNTSKRVCHYVGGRTPVHVSIYYPLLSADHYGDDKGGALQVRNCIPECAMFSLLDMCLNRRIDGVTLYNYII